MKGYIERLVQGRLEQSLNSHLITMIIGPRQVGKSTLMDHAKELVEHNKSTEVQGSAVVLSRNVFTYILDDIQIRSSLKKDIRYIQKDIELSLGETLEKTEQPVYIFIDEVQKMPSLFDWIKQVFDANCEHIKFVLSGSSALSITSVASETLAGRVEYINIYPFIYAELLQAKTGVSQHFFTELITEIDGYTKVSGDGDILSQLSAKSTQQQDTYCDLLTYLKKKLPESYSALGKVAREATACVVETLFYGGLPRVVVSTIEERTRMLKNYIDVYMEKEIGTLARNLDLELFGLSLQSFAQQNGTTLNINQVSKDVGISRPSLYKYLDLLENTYLIKKIHPYAAGGVSEEATKSIVMYYLDTGILNNLSYVTSIPEMMRPDTFARTTGTWLLGTILASWSMLPQVPVISYWQDYAGHKIDFVFERGDFSFGIVLSRAKDPRRVKATLEKFAETNQKKNIIILYPFLDAIGMNMEYKLEEWSFADKRVLTLDIPMQFLG